MLSEHIMMRVSLRALGNNTHMWGAAFEQGNGRKNLIYSSRCDGKWIWRPNKVTHFESMVLKWGAEWLPVSDLEGTRSGLRWGLKSKGSLHFCFQPWHLSVFTRLLSTWHMIDIYSLVSGMVSCVAILSFSVGCERLQNSVTSEKCSVMF